ncbi:MAG TPA: hypothetical protein VFC00_30830 [Micromonosporaceae bacterium]|nr:hypothetical protein [Micromonosporaceae bacterium]
MTTDSEQLPSARAIAQAIAAANQSAQEKAQLRHILTAGITLIAVGAIVGIGANVAVTVATDGHLDWVRHWKGTAHWLGVSGVVLVASYMVMVAIRRLDGRLARLERQRPGAQDALGWPGADDAVKRAHAKGYVDGVRRRLNGDGGGSVLPFEKP